MFKRKKPKKAQSVYVELYWKGSPLRLGPDGKGTGIDRYGDEVPLESCFLLLKKKRVPLSRNINGVKKSRSIKVDVDETLDLQVIKKFKEDIYLVAERADDSDGHKIIIKVFSAKRLLIIFSLPLGKDDHWHKPTECNDSNFASLRARGWVDDTNLE